MYLYLGAYTSVQPGVLEPSRTKHKHSRTNEKQKPNQIKQNQAEPRINIGEPSRATHKYRRTKQNLACKAEPRSIKLTIETYSTVY